MGNKLGLLPVPSATDEDGKDRGVGNELAYASTFFLKAPTMDKYVFADEVNCCRVGSAIRPTSLMTFHGEGGKQINMRGDTDLVKVKNLDIVTVYANIHSGGQYLCPGTGKFAKKMVYRGEANNLDDATEFEFIVRRVEADKKTAGFGKTLSFRRLRFPFKSRRSMSDDLALVDTNGGSRTPPAGSSSRGGVAKFLSVKRPSTPSLMQLGSGNKNSWGESIESNQSASAQTGTNGQEASTLISVDAQPKGSSTNLVEGAADGDCDEESVANVQDESELGLLTEEVDVTNEENQQQEKADDLLLLGDLVTLESKARPGMYLSAKWNTGSVQLSSSLDSAQFLLAVPQLRHLVLLNNDTNGSHMLSHTFQQQDEVPAQTEPKRELSEAEANWLRRLQELPLDIVYRILQFKGRWVGTARLVSKEWNRAATLHIHGIRVNAEFACISTLSEKQAFVSFVGRCRHLLSLRIRNMDDLWDEDLQSIVPCSFLRTLSLGGCRKISDGCMESVSAFSELTSLTLAATSITDETLVKVYEHHPKLTYLNIYGCRRVTIAGISKVLELKCLESINVRGCPVEKSVLDSLQREYPGVQILTGPLNPDGVFS